MYMGKGVGATSRTRYYERATLLFKRAVLLGILEPYLVPTTEMIADVFTKAVDPEKFYLCRDTMMNTSGSSLKAALAYSYKATTGKVHRMIGSVYDALFRKGGD